jgi:hypothetical protein
MAATNEQIRKEVNEGKEVTMQQYNEMQRMGRPKKKRKSWTMRKIHTQRRVAVSEIGKMGSPTVPQALVALTEGASEHNLEQLTLAMNCMADEPSVRGLMIQQGVLAACIKAENAEGPTETNVMKGSSVQLVIALPRCS